MERPAESMSSHSLSTLPTPVRVLFTCFLLTIGIGYITALIYLYFVDVAPHLKMGMNIIQGIAMKYHGTPGGSRLEAALRGPMADRASPAEKQAIIGWIRSGSPAEGFASIRHTFENNCMACHSPKSGLPVPPLTTFEEVRKFTEVDTGTSVSQLARVSHIHLFGISIIFLLTGSIFALSEISPNLRILIIVVPYLAIWADIGAWWVTKYEPFFAWAVLIGGLLMGLALATQILISLWAMWLRTPAAVGPVVRATG
ncbi:MAG TPA: hypothetical protein VHE58_10940 [Burkholderiales bacterium]|nr:hypothetical protein [Burkholderiales bacterium]